MLFHMPGVFSVLCVQLKSLSFAALANGLSDFSYERSFFSVPASLRRVCLQKTDMKTEDRENKMKHTSKHSRYTPVVPTVCDVC